MSWDNVVVSGGVIVTLPENNPVLPEGVTKEGAITFKVIAPGAKTGLDTGADKVAKSSAPVKVRLAVVLAEEITVKFKVKRLPLSTLKAVIASNQFNANLPTLPTLVGLTVGVA